LTAPHVSARDLASSDPDMNTTIIGTRLQDETGTDFLVISVPWESMATPEVGQDPEWQKIPVWPSSQSDFFG
jgi:hypothetical protein